MSKKENDADSPENLIFFPIEVIMAYILERIRKLSPRDNLKLAFKENGWTW